MAYRNPAFIARNYVAEEGVGAISTANAVATGFGKERLIDYRHGTNLKFAASASNHWLEVDFGASGHPTLNRMIIPVGHNLSGTTLTLKSGASAPPGTTRATGSPGAGLIDLSWANASDRFWRLEITGTGIWELPEWWLGERRQVVTGPRPAWELPLYTPAVVRSFATREAVLASGPARRRLRMEHQALSGTDLSIYDEVLARSVALPFWFYAPDDALADPILMRLSEDAGRAQDHPNPQAGPTYTVRLAAVEQTS